MTRGRPKSLPVPATCHPDRVRFHSNGFCKSCYRKSLPSYREYTIKQNEKRRIEREEYRKIHPKPPPKFDSAVYNKQYYKNRSQETKTEQSIKARIRNLAYYGITEQDYQEMFDAQDGKCYICERPPKKVSLNVDHEHQKNEKKVTPASRKIRIRGLICHRCNRALGLFGNNIDALMLASKNFDAYMNRYYAKRLRDRVGTDEAIRLMNNATDYLEAYETRKLEQDQKLDN